MSRPIAYRTMITRPAVCALPSVVGGKASAPATPASPASPFDALVLDAGLRQSLVTVRSLGRRGLSVAALETNTNVPAFASRWCQRKFVCPTGYATDVYLDFLERLLESSGARVLISSHDGTIALLRQNRSRLEQRVRIALASEQALSIAVSKERTL